MNKTNSINNNSKNINENMYIYVDINVHMYKHLFSRYSLWSCNTSWCSLVIISPIYFLVECHKPLQKRKPVSLFLQAAERVSNRRRTTKIIKVWRIYLYIIYILLVWQIGTTKNVSCYFFVLKNDIFCIEARNPKV